LAVGKILARKKLGYAKKTSYVTWRYSDTIMNPLPGNDQWRVL
jgi:hypothetical protein